MKRILLGVLAVAILSAVGIYAVAYVKEQNRVEAEKREKQGQQEDKDKRNAQRDAKVQVTSAEADASAQAELPAEAQIDAEVGEVRQCQFDMAVADIGEDATWELTEEWIRETLQVRGGEVPLDEAMVDWARPERPLDQFFADHGYVC
jgi:uncharacterized protein HemX